MAVKPIRPGTVIFYTVTCSFHVIAMYGLALTIGVSPWIVFMATCAGYSIVYWWLDPFLDQLLEIPNHAPKTPQVTQSHQ